MSPRGRTPGGSGESGRRSSRGGSGAGSGRSGPPRGSGQPAARNQAGAARGDDAGSGRGPRTGRGAGGKAGAKRVTANRAPRPTRRQRAAAGDALAPDVHVPDGVRLQKVLSQAGVASRRACEQLIAEGRVTVDGVVVRELGVRIDPDRSVLHVDGIRVQLDSSRVYLALNKPEGIVCTLRDPQGRPCVGDIIEARTDRLFHVGRLDTETEGLLLLTNDGELAHRLAHPAYEVPKVYLAEIPAPVPRGLGRQLRDGVELDDGPARVDSFKLVDSRPGKALVEVVLHEGRNRIVRRLMDEVGHPVSRLVRVQVGPILLGDLTPGRTRTLTRDEVGELMRLVEL
ncbi:MAG: pseudouridine synthase [Actinomycetales bacterium]